MRSSRPPKPVVDEGARPGIERAPRGRRSCALRLLAASLLGACLGEGALHVRPGLLPESYLGSFPWRGIELFHPGVLGRTPIDALPMPPGRAYAGPPPADLKALGLAPASAGADRLEVPWIRLPADARGLPNGRALERARILLVGDSFLVSAASVEPPGLVPRLSSALGGSVYDLAVSGIGPRHGLWLLEEIGMALEPELVVWFLYGGNDLADERTLLELESAGVRTHADKPGYRRPPRLRSLSLARALAAAPPPRTEAPLPGFVLRSPRGTERSLWFLPDNVWQLALDRTQWEEHAGWPSTRAALLRAQAVAREGGARLVLVYLPSKAEVYWPYVERDPELLRRFLAWGSDAPPSLDPAAVLARTLANRNALESLLAAFCAERDLPFLSARPVLEERARRGELVYLSTDTHWDGDGQAALVAPLAELLRSLR